MDNNQNFNGDNSNMENNNIPVIGLPETEGTVDSVSLKKPEDVAPVETPVNNMFAGDMPVNNGMTFNNDMPVNNGMTFNNDMPVNNGMTSNNDMPVNNGVPFNNEAQFNNVNQANGPAFENGAGYNAYGQPVYNNNFQNANNYQPAPKNGKAIGALVFGILSLVICPLGLILGAVALIMGIMSKKDTGKISGMAIGGIITGSVGLLLGLIAAFYFAIVGVAMGSSISDYSSKANASSDAQVCRDVYYALQTVMYDDDVMYERDFDVPQKGKHELSEFVESLGENGEKLFYETMGVRSAGEINSMLKAEGHKGKNSKSGIYVKIKNGSMSVYIPDSCPSGKGKDCDDKDDEDEIGM